MATNISKISGVLAVSVDSGEPKYYFEASGKYQFSTDETKLNLQIFYSPGVDEFNINYSDLTVNGQAPTSVENAKVLLNAVFRDANTSSGGSGASTYLVYTFIGTQSGTNAPVMTVLENTLGGTVIWTREGLGDYKGTLAGAFTVDKVWGVFCTPSYNGTQIVSGGIQRIDDNSVQLYVSAELDTNGDIFSGEIRVYS